MLEEKTTETGEPTENPIATSDLEPEKTTSNESENADGSPVIKPAETVEDILTTEEKARKDELVNASQKHQNDLKAIQGRERKSWDDEKQQLHSVIDTLKNAVNTNNGNSTANPADSDDDLHNPSQPWMDENGNLNLEALPEWLLRASQVQDKSVKKANEEITALRNTLTGIQTDGKAVVEAQNWQNKFGISADDYNVFENLKKTQGDIAAFEFLNITKKEVDGQRAAQAQRDKERGRAPIFSSGDAASPVRESSDEIDSLAQELANEPFGEERTMKLYEIHERVSSPEVASAILDRAAILTKSSSKQSA